MSRMSPFSQVSINALPAIVVWMFGRLCLLTGTSATYVLVFSLRSTLTSIITTPNTFSCRPWTPMIKVSLQTSWKTLRILLCIRSVPWLTIQGTRTPPLSTTPSSPSLLMVTMVVPSSTVAIIRTTSTRTWTAWILISMSCSTQFCISVSRGTSTAVCPPTPTQVQDRKGTPAGILWKAESLWIPVQTKIPWRTPTSWISILRLSTITFSRLLLSLVVEIISILRRTDTIPIITRLSLIDTSLFFPRTASVILSPINVLLLALTTFIPIIHVSTTKPSTSYPITTQFGRRRRIEGQTPLIRMTPTCVRVLFLTWTSLWVSCPTIRNTPLSST